MIARKVSSTAKVTLSKQGYNSIAREATGHVASVFASRVKQEYLNASRDGDPYGGKWFSTKLSHAVQVDKDVKSVVWIDSVPLMDEPWRRHRTIGYASFHEKGTGLYGPKNKRIVPLRKNKSGLIKFVGKRPPWVGDSFALRSVRGMRKSRVWGKALDSFKRDPGVSVKKY